jgi:hypothetical protein
MYRRRTVTNKCQPVVVYVMPFRKEGQHVDIRTKVDSLAWGLQGVCVGNSKSYFKGEA